MKAAIAHKRRVSHIMDVCFNQTETFVYEFVRGCPNFEPTCFARSINRPVGFDVVPAIRISTDRSRLTLVNCLDRIFARLLRADCIPFYRAILRTRPHVMHAHFGDIGYMALHYAKMFKTPLITSFYGHDASALPLMPGWGKKLRDLFVGGSAFLAEGPAMKNRLSSLGCPPEKIHLLPITINLQEYVYRERSIQPGEAFRILFVGRFVPKKGLSILLQALSNALPNLGKCELRIVGGGGEMESMIQLAESLGISHVVKFLGFRTRSEMVSEMEASHALAVPSMTAPNGDSEGGAPTILLEAQATGLPIIATEHADIPYVVSKFAHSYLSPEQSVDGFAKNLIKLRSNARQWPSLGNSGREHVERQHGHKNFQALEEIYGRAIDGKL